MLAAAAAEKRRRRKANGESVSPARFVYPRGKARGRAAREIPNSVMKIILEPWGRSRREKFQGEKIAEGVPGKASGKKFSPLLACQRESKKNEQQFQFLHCAPSSFSHCPPLYPGVTSPRAPPLITHWLLVI